MDSIDIPLKELTFGLRCTWLCGRRRRDGKGRRYRMRCYRKILDGGGGVTGGVVMGLGNGGAEHAGHE